MKAILAAARYQRRLILAALAASLTLGAAGAAHAQSVDPSQLMGIFNNLSADQQQQLLQKLGGASATGSGSQSSSRNTEGTNNANRQETQQRHPKTQAEIDALLPDELQPLKPGDTVLIDVDFEGEGNAQKLTATQLAAQQATQTNQAIPAGALLQQPAPSQQNGNANGSNNNNGNGNGNADIKKPELSEREREKLKALIDLIRERNPYTLDRNGVLLLPGFAGIQISGLNQDQATKRVAAEPALRQFDIQITRLPLAKSGQAALKPYGYDLFEDGPSTFAPLGDVPVPSDYVLGAGDELSVQLYGSQNRTTRLTVGRDGRINFPELGPINAAGRSFSSVLSEIEGRVSRQMIGTRASVSMGEARSIRVFVMGEAKYPGSYTVSGLATVTGALFAAGGVKPIGSLRDIQIRRQGKLVRRFDLYDLLMRGDTSNDVSLLSGDVILIPPVGATVIVDGEVRRPAIYELKGAATAGDLIGMAGGFTTDADSSKAALTRINEQRQRVVVEIDPTASGAASATIRNGDALRVATLRPTLDSGVTLQGEVFRPGNFAWRDGLRLSDVIGSVNELKSNADPHYLLIRREVGPERRITAVSADLTAALARRGSAADIPLTAHDQIMVFDLGSGRERVIKPLMSELKLQASPSAPAQVVNASGRLKAPGDYPLDTDMRVSDLIRAGGSLEDAAFGGEAELSRYVIEDGQTRRTQVIKIDLAAVLRGDESANLLLQPFDGLYIKEISGWSEQQQVELKGEVRFPGIYPIKRGETLHSVIERAGGLTDLAFAEGGVFTRDELKKREQEQLDRLAERMKSDLVSVSLMAARANQTGATQTYNIGQSLVDQLKAAKAVGRLVIDLPAVVAGATGSAADVILRNGDQLIVPKRRQEVTVMGEVQNVTSHLYQTGRSRDDYVALSGGTTRQADRNKIYVVRADGSVVANNSGWLFRGGKVPIRTGDTIVVPLDTERTPALPMWQSITQILYNLAVTLAAIRTF